jgi:hypothetical protein
MWVNELLGFGRVSTPEPKPIGLLFNLIWIFSPMPHFLPRAWKKILNARNHEPQQRMRWVKLG